MSHVKLVAKLGLQAILITNLVMYCPYHSASGGCYWQIGVYLQRKHVVELCL